MSAFRLFLLSCVQRIKCTICGTTSEMCLRENIDKWSACRPSERGNLFESPTTHSALLPLCDRSNTVVGGGPGAVDIACDWLDSDKILLYAVQTTLLRFSQVGKLPAEEDGTVLCQTSFCRDGPHVLPFPRASGSPPFAMK